MKDFKLSRFITITIVAVIGLSIAWNFVGKNHTALIVHVINPALSDGIHLSVENNVIGLTVRRDILPVGINVNHDGKNAMAWADVLVSDPALREFWFSKLPNSTARSYTYSLEPRVLQTVLITALALMLGLPGMSLKGRSVGLILVYVSGICGQLISLYLIILRYQWLANGGRLANHWYRDGGWNNDDAILVTCYLFAVFAPLLIFIPILFSKWRYGPSPANL